MSPILAFAGIEIMVLLSPTADGDPLPDAADWTWRADVKPRDEDDAVVASFAANPREDGTVVLTVTLPDPGPYVFDVMGTPPEEGAAPVIFPGPDADRGQIIVRPSVTS